MSKLLKNREVVQVSVRYFQKSNLKFLKPEREVKEAEEDPYKVAYPTDQLLYESMNITPTKLRSLLSPDDPIKHPDYFGVSDLVSVKSLYEHRVHLGHKTGTLHERMEWAVWGIRLNICIIDLDITAQRLFKALNFLAHMAYRDSMFLFVTNDRQNIYNVEKVALECGEYPCARAWRPSALLDIRNFHGIDVRLPECVIMQHTQNNAWEPHPAIYEAAKMNIPTVGLVDTNCDPLLITYPIPANDDTEISVIYMLSLFKEAIFRGKAARKKKLGIKSEEFAEPEKIQAETSGTLTPPVASIRTDLQPVEKERSSTDSALPFPNILTAKSKSYDEGNYDKLKDLLYNLKNK